MLTYETIKVGMRVIGVGACTGAGTVTEVREKALMGKPGFLWVDAKGGLHTFLFTPEAAAAGNGYVEVVL